MSTPMQDLFHKEMFEGEIHTLNTLLNNEITEVEVYNQAMQKVKDTELIPTLEASRNAHAHRVEVLRDRIINQGGTPSKGSGIVGGITKFLEEAASLVNDQTVVAVLAGSEEFCLNEYEKHLQGLDPESWSVAESDLLPSQKKTHDTIKKLATFMRSDESDKNDGKYHLSI